MFDQCWHPIRIELISMKPSDSFPWLLAVVYFQEHLWPLRIWIYANSTNLAIDLTAPQCRLNHIQQGIREPITLPHPPAGLLSSWTYIPERQRNRTVTFRQPPRDHPFRRMLFSHLKCLVLASRCGFSRHILELIHKHLLQLLQRECRIPNKICQGPRTLEDWRLLETSEAQPHLQLKKESEVFEHSLRNLKLFSQTELPTY